MKRWKAAAILILVSIFSAIELTSANSGTPPLGQTNAPGEQNCTACHNSFGINSGNGRLTLINVPREYRPGQAYRIDLEIKDLEHSNWGFELTVLNDKGDRAGTIAVVDGTLTELRSGSAGSGPRDYLVNTIAGNFAGVRNKVTYQFEWTAPAQNSGTITFYASGVAGDRDGSARGDRVYLTTAAARVFENRPPSLNFLTPNHGPEDGGTRATLRGENFREGVSVTFDGADAQGQFIDETTIKVISPPHRSGVVDVRVANSDGTSVTAAGAFIYDKPPPPPPKALFLLPDRGTTAGGLNVKLSGLNFQVGSRVIFDGRELPTTYVDDNFLSFKTPLHNPGLVGLVVLNPDGQRGELKSAFTYDGPIPAPVIKLLFPLGGEVLSAGGAPVTISWSIESNGTPLQRLLISTDGGATFPIVLATGLSATVSSYNLIVPEELANERVRLRLEVSQPEATVTDDTKRDFKIVRAPILDKVTPATSKAGTTRLDLEITGQGFAKDAVVEMDGVKLKATVVSATSIKVKKAPHNVPGLHFIRVRNPNGGISRNFLFTVAQ